MEINELLQQRTVKHGLTRIWCTPAGSVQPAHEWGRGSRQSGHLRARGVVACRTISQHAQTTYKTHVRIDVQHGGEGEGNGFAATSLRDGNNIVATEGHWPRLALDGCWSREALGADSGHDVLGEADFLEGGDRPWNSAALDL